MRTRQGMARPALAHCACTPAALPTDGPFVADYAAHAVRRRADGELDCHASVPRCRGGKGCGPCAPVRNMPCHGQPSAYTCCPIRAVITPHGPSVPRPAVRLHLGGLPAQPGCAGRIPPALAMCASEVCASVGAGAPAYGLPIPDADAGAPSEGGGIEPPERHFYGWHLDDVTDRHRTDVAIVMPLQLRRLCWTARCAAAVWILIDI